MTFRYLSCLALFLFLAVSNPLKVWAGQTDWYQGGTFSASGGDLDGHEIGLLTGNSWIPLSRNYGFQIDGLGAYSKNSISGSLGGHLFWRDPETGHLGVYAAYMDRGWPNIDGIGNIAIEGAYFTGNWNLSAILGYEFDDRDEVFLASFISWYPETDDTHLFLGFSEQLGQQMIYAGFEFDPEWREEQQTILFLNSIYTGCKETLVHLGVRFYFGGPKSLKSRHREEQIFSPVAQGNLLNLDSCGRGASNGGGGGEIIGM